MGDGQAWSTREDVTVLVLAGGLSTRFSGDKLAADVGGSTVLDHLLSDLPPGWPVVLVGPVRAVERSGVSWVREDPPDGGPLAAVAAGVVTVRTALVAVVAGDMPHAAGALGGLLEGLAADGVVAAVAVDAAGRANPLLAVYRTDDLRAALPADPDGQPARRLLGLSHTEVRVAGSAARDIDTPDDLERLRRDG